MATQEQRDLAKQATTYKKENPNYYPAPDVLSAVDAVLIEQAQKRLESTRTAADWIAAQEKTEKKDPIVWRRFAGYSGSETWTRAWMERRLKRTST